MTGRKQDKFLLLQKKSLSLGKNLRACWDKLHWVTEEFQVLHRDAFIPILVKQSRKKEAYAGYGQIQLLFRSPSGFSDSIAGSFDKNSAINTDDTKTVGYKQK